jgi:ABC-type Mn2+/Zn2+ transport system ATPase subunit
VGIVGPNGAGKTTFLRGVLGQLPMVTGAREVERALRFAYVPQIDELNLYWPLTIREAVRLSLRARRPFGRTTAEEDAAAEKAMADVGVTAIQDRLLSEVSGGQRQKTILAQALCQKPDVLLLDEPTRGLDVVAERDFMSLIDACRRNDKLTILLVTHSLQIPLNFTEKILLFDKGRVIETTPNELVHTKKLEDIYGVPFSHQEQDGLKWVAPTRGRV